MKTKFIFVLLASIFVLAISCQKSTDADDVWEERWTIASEKTECMGMDMMLPCYWIRRNDNPVWERMDADIEGFQYEEGYEYVVDLKVARLKNPPADASNRKYSLIRIISREKKESDVPKLTAGLSKFFPELHEESEGSDSLIVFQGDMILSDSQMQSTMTKSGCLADQIDYWPRNTVYYTFAENFIGQTKVLNAINEWESKTSLSFVNGVGNGNYIEFFNRTGNFSSVGMVGGKQQISLYSDYRSSTGTAIHEIGHAVGLIHEHCRNDRDSYVQIHWDNIKDGKDSNFYTYSAGDIADIGIFDFGSVMLYSSNAFSKDSSLPTMTTLDGLCFVGQRTHLSDGDVKGVEAMYGPPFHDLERDERVYKNEINGFYEIYEAEVIFTIKIYADKECTIPVSLTKPRKITVYKNRYYYDPNSNRVIETVEKSKITLPVGTKFYNIGRVYNKEKYFKSDPEIMDVTYYSISPYNDL